MLAQLLRCLIMHFKVELNNHSLTHSLTHCTLANIFWQIMILRVIMIINYSMLDVVPRWVTVEATQSERVGLALVVTWGVPNLTPTLLKNCLPMSSECDVLPRGGRVH